MTTHHFLINSAFDFGQCLCLEFHAFWMILPLKKDQKNLRKWWLIIFQSGQSWPFVMPSWSMKGLHYSWIHLWSFFRFLYKYFFAVQVCNLYHFQKSIWQWMNRHFCEMTVNPIGWSQITNVLPITHHMRHEWRPNSKHKKYIGVQIPNTGIL